MVISEYDNLKCMDYILRYIHIYEHNVVILPSIPTLQKDRTITDSYSKYNKNASPPLLCLFLLGFLSSSDHFTSVTVPSGRTSLDGRVLKWGGGYCYFTATLLEENKIN